MLKHIVLVGLGGAIGSILRFTVTLALRSSLFPYGTFLVNLIGSFVIGLAFAYSLRNPVFETNWRLFITAGLCGGFTTFSAFSLENFSLLQQQKIALFLVYTAGSVLCGLLATWAGYKLGA